MSEIITVEQDNKQANASLTLANEEFAKVVLEFLGDKQELGFFKDNDFLLTLNDLEQFYYIIEEKLNKEHHTYIDHFKVTFFYNDGTHKEIAGIEKLNKFHENRDVYPEEVLLTWNVILNFPNQVNVSNQIIRLKFIIDSSSYSKYLKERTGSYIVNIEHTNEVWANEILTLFKDKISEVSIDYGSLYKSAVKIKNTLFALGVFPSILVLILVIFTFSTLLYKEHNKIEPFDYGLVQSISTSSDKNNAYLVLFAIDNLAAEELEKFNEKNIVDLGLKKEIDKVISLKKMKEERYSIFPVLYGIFGISFSFLLVYLWVKSTIKYYQMNSFILINKRSDNKYSNYISDKSKVEYYSVSLIVFTLISGIIANYIFNVIN